MAVLFWYIVKSDASIRYCTVLNTFYKIPETHGHVLQVDPQIQAHQLYIAVLFWYTVKSDASVRYCTVSNTFYKIPETHGHVLQVDPQTLKYRMAS